MKKIARIASVVVLGLATTLSAQPTRPAEPVKQGQAPYAEVPFKGRTKFEQKFERVLKISVDPEAMPFDSDTLTTVVNSPAVAGKAARDTFGLTQDEFGTYINLKASTSIKPGAVIAKLEIGCRADGRIPAPALNAFIENLRKYLQVTLEESINLDRRNLEKRQDALLERKNYLEKKYVEVWTNRVRVAEDAGLAEHSVEGHRGTVAEMEANLRDIEVEMALRQTRLEFTKKEMTSTSTSDSMPKVDPLADELEKLVRIRARQLEAAGNAGTDEDDRDAAEARMVEAKLRWIERIEELEKLKPENRIKVLEKEVAELETRKAVYTKNLESATEQARGLFRYHEHVLLLTKKEVLLDKAIERIEEQVDDLANYSEKLGTITVSIIGQAD